MNYVKNYKVCVLILGVVVICTILFLCPTKALAAEETTETTTETTTEVTTQSKPVIVLKRPVIKKWLATSNAQIKLSWSKVQNASGYIIYRSNKSKGNYKQIGMTKKTYYTDKKGKQSKKYYYKVRAYKKVIGAEEMIYSTYSKSVAKKVRKIARKTAYAGDSIMTGFPGYGVVHQSHKLKVFAKVGINTSAFYNGEYMKQLLKYNPDRLYIMMGMNGLTGSPSDASMDNIISSYNKIVTACHKKNPNMEIYVIGVSPVGRSASVRTSSVQKFNRKLKKKMKSKSYVYYYSLDSVLADSSGYLKYGYGGGDGIHWSKTAYEKVQKAFKKIAKESR